MLGSNVLEVATGLVFFYCLLATLCAACNDWLASLLHIRSTTLRRGIQQLLGGEADSLLLRLYEHPLIKGTAQRDEDPSHIPAHNFSTALIEILSERPPEESGQQESARPNPFRDLEKGIHRLPDGKLRRGLLSQLSGLANDMEQVQVRIERWFDDSMTAASGWYKQWAKRSALLLSLLFAILINGDTLALASSLWRDPMLRETAANTARKQHSDGAGGTTQLSLAEAQKEINSLHPPLGWSHESVPRNPSLPWYWDSQLWWWLLGKSMGLLLTALAASLGAPFWFDLLNRSTKKAESLSSWRGVLNRTNRDPATPAPAGATNNDAGTQSPAGTAAV